MGIVLFSLFAVAEIALAVSTFTKQTEKSVWYKHKTLCRAAEFIIALLVVILPFAYRKWRFAGCVAILAIRLIISGIACLINKNSTKTKSKAAASFGALFSILLTGISLAPAFVITGYQGIKTTGQYGVKTADAILTDESRIEEHENDGSNREVPIHFYYPDGNAKDCPFVLFAHGSFGYYESNSSLYEELASNGYVVASIDHPYYAFFTTDTNGNTIIVDMNFLQSAIDCQNGKLSAAEEVKLTQEWMKTRTADENFVLDTLKSAKASASLDNVWNTEMGDEILGVLAMTDMTKIGLTGHSIGGAVAVQLGRERDDITAVVDIDGTMLGEKIDYSNTEEFVFNTEPYPIPFLELNNASSYNAAYSSDYRDEQGRQYINVYTLNNAVDGREMHFENTEHMDFTDLPLLSPTLANMLGKGTVNSDEFVPQINGIILNYFNYYLKGEGELTVGNWTPIN